MKMKRSRSLSPKASCSEDDMKRMKLGENEKNDIIIMHPHILDFSDDVLLNIFKYLNPQDLMAISLSCQRLAQVAQDKTLWRRVDFRVKPILLNDLKEYIKFFQPMTVSLAVRGSLHCEKEAELSPYFFSSIKNSCTQLKELTIEEYYINGDKIQITDFPRTIEKLSLEGCKMGYLRGNKSYFFKMNFHMPNLTCLILSNCQWFTPHSLLVISKMPKLKELRLNSCHRLGECVAYTSLATRFGFKTLEILDLRDTALGDSEVGCFSCTKTLTHLYLECPFNLRNTESSDQESRPLPPEGLNQPVYEDDNLVQFVVEAGFRWENYTFGRCLITDRAICALGIDTCDRKIINNSAEGFIVVEDDKRIFNNPHLKTLVVRNYPYVTNSSLVHLALNASSLEYLDGYISMSNGCYKQFEAYKGISRNMAKLSNKSSNSEQIESCIVSSGMRLVCECRNSFTTTLGCFLPAGAMYEMPKERGSAIFLEHLLFRRTQHNNQEQLEKLLGEIGGKVAAIAMRDMFIFYGTVLPHEVDKLIQLFADVILNGIICDEDVEREKCVILYELSKMELDKEKVIMDYLPTVAYQDTALANGVYPETDTIKKFCTENLIEFRDRLFKTYFMTMVCTGSIGLEKFKRLVCKHFTIEEDDNESPIDLANNVQSCIESFQCRFSGCDFRLRDDDEELGYVALGFEGPSYKQPEDHLILTVAKEIVGSWDKSCSGANHNAPYIAHCAFNTDFCYMYKSFFHNWAQCTSMWGCYFVSNKLDQENMVDLLQREWMKLCTTITQKEVLRAVNQCKLKDLIVLSDPTSRFFDIVQYIFRYGYYEPIQNRILEYEKITTDKLKETCEKYIYDQNPTVVAIGRIENLPHYYVIRDGMYLLRY